MALTADGTNMFVGTAISNIYFWDTDVLNP